MDYDGVSAATARSKLVHDRIIACVTGERVGAAVANQNVISATTMHLILDTGAGGSNEYLSSVVAVENIVSKIQDRDCSICSCKCPVGGGILEGATIRIVVRKGHGSIAADPRLLSNASAGRIAYIGYIKRDAHGSIVRQQRPLRYHHAVVVPDGSKNTVIRYRDRRIVGAANGDGDTLGVGGP